MSQVAVSSREETYELSAQVNELSDKVIDWKGMWFYVRNLSSSLSLRTPGPPVKRPSWNSKGAGADQVNFLLGEIEVLKAEHEITGASVVAHWTIRRV